MEALQDDLSNQKITLGVNFENCVQSFANRFVRLLSKNKVISSP